MLSQSQLVECLASIQYVWISSTSGQDWSQSAAMFLEQIIYYKRQQKLYDQKKASTSAVSEVKLLKVNGIEQTVV